jgi:catechol 2,3-dioxygenase-like lactoylglutathione lyase family enzyme
MAKLRHIAMQVPDLEKAAAFYETVFELDRVAQAVTPIGDNVMLSDGVINLTLLHLPEGSVGAINTPDWAGLYHFGFVVDDKDDTIKRIEEMGGEFFMQIPDDLPGVDAETKYKDPNGVVFDIADHDWSQSRNKP